MKRIGVIHATVSSVIPLEDEFARQSDSFEILNFVDENMLKRIGHENGLSHEARREFMKLFFRVLDADVDAVIIACTVYSGLADIMNLFTDIPVLAADGPMLEKAALSSTRIGVMATNKEAGVRASEEIRKYADILKKQVNVETVVLKEAYRHLRSGEPDLHDEILLAGAKKLIDDGAEIIVLAQITMARASLCIENAEITVITSPTEAVKSIMQLLG